MFHVAAGWKLKYRDWALLAFLFVLFSAFGALVVWRSCFMQFRHTDFGVYARAAWAIRSGADLYGVTDDGGLHYCYPPPFAIMMLPFAEPPRNNNSDGFLPFATSVAIWYVLSGALAFAAAHVIARAIESTLPFPVDHRRWWGLRLWPLLLILPALGNNFSHGQVNTLLLFLIAGMIAALVQNRAKSAGTCLAGAIALKVFPAFLLLLPLRQRSHRFLMACAAAGLVLLFAMPAVVWGPRGAWNVNQRFIDVMIKPAVASASGSDRSQEMFHLLRTDNQSIQAIAHAWQHFGNADAPAEASRSTKSIHWLIGAAMTMITLAAASRKCRGNDRLLECGALVVVMLFISPMCHLHYFVLTLPLITGLLFRLWYEDAGKNYELKLSIAFVLHVVGGAVPLIFERYRNLGFAPLTTVPLWAIAISELRLNRNAIALPIERLRKAA